MSSISEASNYQSISSPTSSSEATSTSSEQITEFVIYPHHFLFLIPTITGIALGILFVPNFGLGLAVGAAELAVSLVSMSVLSNMGIVKSSREEKSEYSKNLVKSLLAVSLFAPIAEEGLFRGLVQPLLAKSIQILVPAAAAAFFGPFTVATAVSVLATSVFFGAVHYFNPHKDSHIQALSATVGGLVYGILAAQFGIGASMAAHIANNSIISCIIAIPLSFSGNERIQVRPQQRFETSPLPS